jgi:DNA processing protein
VNTSLAERIQQTDRQEASHRALAWSQQQNHAILTLADSDYPPQLLEIPDPPPLLYVRGHRHLLAANSIAIVGSRSATHQGIANAEQFARALSNGGWTITSGLALGIDAAAHRGGLAGPGATIAVVGHGVDRLYPQSNLVLAQHIANQGVIVSEFPLGAPPLRGNFPRRNRLIAGLSRGCLVVEAALGSGSLITARLALEQGREVFAIPGSIHSPVSRGCHALIKQGAKLVETGRDVLDELGGVVHHPLATTTAERDNKGGLERNPSPPELRLLQHMGYDPCTLDTLISLSGLTAETVSAMLLQLELEGRVVSLPGALYQRVLAPQ